VSTLAFLTPEATDVAARSPMYRQAAAAGARFETRDGWEVATSYAPGADHAQTVAFADRSHLAKLELHGPAPIELRPGTAVDRDGTWWCPVTPARTVVLGGPEARETVSAAGGTFVDLTSNYAALALIGPLANELLARFCAIDVRARMMPVAAFRPGSVARTPGYVLRTGEQELLIMVGWALGAYLWDVVADAAEHLGGGPVA
jgi:heterotetrameric sarcosine oxidase gamma subunit